MCLAPTPRVSARWRRAASGGQPRVIRTRSRARSRAHPTTSRSRLTRLIHFALCTFARSQYYSRFHALLLLHAAVSSPPPFRVLSPAAYHFTFCFARTRLTVAAGCAVGLAARRTARLCAERVARPHFFTPCRCRSPPIPSLPSARRIRLCLRLLYRSTARLLRLTSHLPSDLIGC